MESNNNNEKSSEQPATDSTNKNKLEILLAEYSACNEGYNSRDLIVFSEFSVLIAIFSGLIVVMTYVLDKLQKGSFSLSMAIFILGILGLLSIIGISIDMQSTHSCKVAIRYRMKKIEEEIRKEYKQLMFLWSDVIENRENYVDKYLLEELYKSGDRETREKEIDLLNYSAYVLIFLWIVIVMIFLWLSGYFPIIFISAFIGALYLILLRHIIIWWLS